MRSPAISYRPLVLAIGALGAMAIAAVNPWAGALLLALTLVALSWHFMGPLGSATPRRRVAVDFDPLSASDYAEMRRRYRRE